jgi:hypothetical protein
VPFANAVRDESTGLNVPQPGCFEFDGDHALAYVRSRKLEVLTDSGEWEQDASSDLGRISRQQDFIRRIADALLSAGSFKPDVIGGLVQTSSDYVVVDSQLTTRKILEFAGVLRAVDPAQIAAYQITASPAVIQGNAVLEPQLGSDNMEAVLSVFQGRATLGSAPRQAPGDEGATATSAPASAATTPASGTTGADGGNDAGPAATAEATTSLPEVDAEQIVYGYLPDDSIRC